MEKSWNLTKKSRKNHGILISNFCVNPVSRHHKVTNDISYQNSGHQFRGSLGSNGLIQGSAKNEDHECEARIDKSTCHVTVWHHSALMMVQFLSDKSGLKTRSLELNTLGTSYSPALSQYVLVSSLSCPKKLSMGPRFKVSSEKLENPIKHTSPGLQVK